MKVSWVVVKIVVPFWIPIKIRHQIFRVPQKKTMILTTTLLGSPGPVHLEVLLILDFLEAKASYFKTFDELLLSEGFRLS